MAATSTANYGDHFGAEKLKEWPDPKAVYLMEALAREDVDRAVHVILLRENYVVKKLDTYLQHLDLSNERRRDILHKKWVENVAQPLQQRILEKVISARGLRTTKQGRFASYLQDTNKTAFVPALSDPLIWKQHEAENRAIQCDTGKWSSLKGIQTARLPANLPHFTCTRHRAIPKDKQRTSARSTRSQGHGPCRPETITCVEKKQLLEEVEKTADPSQRAFEKQFIISRLNQETKRDRRKELVSRGLPGAGAGPPPQQPD
ncbi:protein FAM228A [Echinops telfairi]|uniref:Protein FAM228A n=1 Tax=Echinops telfairi TaxID=9371 RepID=A0ABM0ZQ23_ECHTE|nr:protein FAM228A [Echinops telfairi]